MNAYPYKIFQGTSVTIPREYINLLLAKIDIVDLIHTHIPLRKKSGDNYFGRCPFHNEKSPSFSVSQSKQFYYCFGCGAHGNAIDFMMQHDHLTFKEAIETLAHQVGMDVPYNTTSIKKDDSSLPALYQLMEKVTQYFYDQMRKSEVAVNYLKRRGISGKIAKQFSLGYAKEGWNHLFDQFGKTESVKKKLLEVGLIIKKEDGGYYDRFRQRIIFPIHDYRGRILGMGGRILDRGEPKYLNSPETILFQKGQELYGLFQALKANRQLNKILVVEGYMDVVALFQHDITYAVATLGTATTPYHFNRLLRYTSEIVFCFDGDEAGRTAAWRALQVIFPLMQDHLQIRFLFLPEGEDPDTLVRKEGKVAFEERLSSALSLSEFFFQTLGNQTDLATIEGRARFASTAINHIKQIPKGILTGILLAELEKRARITLSDFKKQGKMPPHQKEIKNSKDMNPHKLKPILHKALALLVQNPSLVKSITHPLPVNNLSEQLFLSQVIEIIKQNPEASTATLIEYWRGQKEEKFVLSLASWQHSIPNEGLENEFLGALRQLNLLAIEEEINKLLIKASQELLTDEEKQQLSGWIRKKKTIQEEAAYS